MSSTLELTFTGTTITEGQTISVTVSSPGGGILYLETFRDIRSANYQVTLSTVSPPIEEGYSTNYANSWNLDYSQSGGSNNLVAVSSGDTTTITLLDSSWQFSTVVGTAVDSGAVTFVVNNNPIQALASFELDSYSADVGSPCDTCDVNLTATGGNEVYNIFEGSDLLVSAQASPFTINFNRGVKTTLRCLDTSGKTIGQLNVFTPRKILDTDISVAITNLSTGANLNITVPFISSYIEPYEYSLDNVTYQEESVYTGLANGTYTLYVRDAFGCVTTKSDIVIDGAATSTEVNFFISELNGIRYFRYDSEKKNQQNTISCDELRKLNYRFTQKFLESDIPSTQFKTNAQYINCYSLDLQGNVNAQVPVKRTENIGLTAKSTSTYFSLGDGRSAIYFGVVDILNYDTDAFIETTDFGFTLPEWANTEGNYVDIEGIGNVPIDSIGYSDDYNAFILEFNFSFSGSPEERNLSAIYNLNEYEIYEFDTTMSIEPEQFHLVIEVGTASDDIKFTYVSERIKRVADSEFLFRVDYWNSQNSGGMNYQTGIKHRLRLEGYQDYIGDQSTEGYDGDTQYFITDNSVYDAQNFLFKRLSSMMAHKMRLVVSQDNLYINGLPYKLFEEPEVTGASSFNLKNFSVTLKTGGDQTLTDANEIITNTPESDSISGAIEASKGKALLLWTKQNG